MVDISKFIADCRSQGVSHVKAEFDEERVEIELTFESQASASMLNSKPAGLDSDIAVKMRARHIGQSIVAKAEMDYLKRRGITIGEALTEGYEAQQAETRAQPPTKRMNDIELAMNPPTDLRDAMSKPLEFELPALVDSASIATLKDAFVTKESK